VTLHPPAKKKAPARRPRPTYRNAAPMTLGHILGEQVRAVQNDRKRQAELEAMGFKPIGRP
jgi:hypothetical protein